MNEMRVLIGNAGKAALFLSLIVAVAGFLSLAGCRDCSSDDAEPPRRSSQNWVYQGDFFFIINTAVGGAWPGRPNGHTRFPQEMRVDYIRLYDQQGNLTWSDEFNQDAVNRENWTFEVGNGHAQGIPGWGNNELEYYTDGDNVSLDEGQLVIEIREEETSDQYGKYQYTSTRMHTSGKVNTEYGRVEVRAKLPKGKGLWPAIWMLGEAINEPGREWPRCGEIDIAEIVGHQPAVVHGTIHGPNHFGSGGISGSYTLPEGSFADSFHVFILEWEPHEIRWYIDDNPEPYHRVHKTAQGEVERTP